MIFFILANFIHIMEFDLDSFKWEFYKMEERPHYIRIYLLKIM